MNSLEMERIYATYSGKVMGYLRARIHNTAEAEDICSEVFEKVMEQAENFKKYSD